MIYADKTDLAAYLAVEVTAVDRDFCILNGKPIEAGH
jgi:hypothetical protein